MRKYSEITEDTMSTRVNDPTIDAYGVRTSFRRDNSILITGEELKSRLHESLKALF